MGWLAQPAVLPWIAFLCVMAWRSVTNERERTLVKVLFAGSLTVHTLGLLFLFLSAIVGLAFAAAWGGGRFGLVAAAWVGMFVTCLGHVGVLLRLARPPGDRLRFASIAAMLVGWVLAAFVADLLARATP